MAHPKELSLPKSLLAKQMMCVYGKRNAGMIWEETYRAALEQMGCTTGRASPCCFVHQDRGLQLVVHGDDLTALRLQPDLDRYEKELPKSSEPTNRGRMGENTELKAMKILNRIVKLTPEA